MHILDEFCVQVLECLDLLTLHLLEVLIGLLWVGFLAEMLDQHRIYVAQLDGIFHSWRVNKGHGDGRHALAVVRIHELPSLTELLKVSDLGQEHVLLLLLVCCVTLIKLALCLDHRFESFFIGAKLINFYLSALVIEV